MLPLLAFLMLTGVQALSDDCRCVFKVGVSASLKASALDYVCGLTNCEPILAGGVDYWPDTIEAHAAWAIDVWFQEHRSTPRQSCDFKGAAEILCAACHCVFNPAVNVTDSQMDGIISYVCNQPEINCAPIYPGGSNYEPDTLQNHSSWAIDAWYQAHDWAPESCDFGNQTAILMPVTCRGR